jgi:TPP-dependent pyruvate/acetoin dehydrogenase alpha subunit
MPIGECRPDVPIVEIGKTFGIVSYRVDGNDILAVYEMAEKADEGCRKGEGPVFMECQTYRLRGHVGPDDNIQGSHTDIRPKEEIEAWRKKDPIVSFEGYLEENGLMGREEIIAIRAEVEREVEEAIEFARGSAFPDPCDLDKYVFAQ